MRPRLRMTISITILRKIEHMRILVMRRIIRIMRTTEGNNDGNWNNHDNDYMICILYYILLSVLQAEPDLPNCFRRDLPF